ncbi:MAG TPA: ATP-binding protein [Conexibacter sp.]|jgi:signal transduction histidine kinase|nr:ATP-binding protein [Conexibacter sp.]
MSLLQAQSSQGAIGSIAGAAERRRIERDLHDGAQNLLVAVRLKLGLAADRAAELGAPDLYRMLVEVGDEAQAALDGIRSVAQGAVPPLLAVRGVADALAAEGDRAALPVRVVGRIPRSTAAAEAAVFYCCLEALQNAAKHAGPAARVTIRLDRTADGIGFAVEDDGAGFAAAERPSARTGGGGLTHMHERVDAVGGAVTIVSRPGGGTSVRGCVPWPQPQVAA